jgi:solute carrier family 35 protein E1
LLFGVSYNAKTYFSLVPLTLGVMLACSFDVSAGNTVGVACAFGSAIVFVTSNIFFKKVMPSEGGAAHKLDKLNMLFYASSTAFVLMVPIWLWTDLPALLGPADTHVTHPARGHDHGSALGLTTAFCANGAVHFAQTALAFVLLARTSPVTYSIASLIKRVAVIVLAVIWFAQPVHPVQGAGIALTFLGLWLYNGAKGDVAAGERRARRVERARNLALPSSRSELADEGAPASHMQDPVPQEQQAQVSFAPGPLSPTRARRTTLPPLATDAQALSYAQHRTQAGHPALPLHITITPPSAHPASAGAPAKGAFAGATPLRADSYPSPPLSLDSPPPEAADPEPTSHATAVAMR